MYKFQSNVNLNEIAFDLYQYHHHYWVDPSSGGSKFLRWFYLSLLWQTQVPSLINQSSTTLISHFINECAKLICKKNLSRFCLCIRYLYNTKHRPWQINVYSKQSKRIVNFKIKHFLSVWQISSCVDRSRIVGEATGSNITTKIVLKSVGCMEMKET